MDRLSKPDTLAGRMQRAVLKVLLEHARNDEIPTNGRFVFYELEQRGVVRKSTKGESRRGSKDDPREQEVIDALTYLREHGFVPWSWIVDETRSLYDWPYAESFADYLDDAIDRARVNPWPGLPPLLLVESRSTAGVVRRIAGEYLAPIAATNGQVGGFLRTEVAPLLGDDRAVLYIGDWDHQGRQIETNTRGVLERLTDRELDWRRLALTEAQIERRDLGPVWKKDHRYKPALEHEAWECEALGQGQIQTLIRDALDALLPEPLGDVLEREEEERREVREMLA